VARGPVDFVFGMAVCFPLCGDKVSVAADFSLFIFEYKAGFPFWTYSVANIPFPLHPSFDEIAFSGWCLKLPFVPFCFGSWVYPPHPGPLFLPAPPLPLIDCLVLVAYGICYFSSYLHITMFFTKPFAYFPNWLSPGGYRVLPFSDVSLGFGACF